MIGWKLSSSGKTQDGDERLQMLESGVKNMLLQKHQRIYGGQRDGQRFGPRPCTRAWNIDPPSFSTGAAWPTKFLQQFVFS